MDFLLRAGRWYAYEMFPGYSEGEFRPYVSPVFMLSVHPLKTGAGKLRLRFYNAAYAEGVRDFDLEVTILYRGTHYLLADLGHSGRCIAIAELNYEWLVHNAPEVMRGGMEDPQDALASLYGFGNGN